MSGSTDRTPSADPEVCVVGAGPAGALAAHRLAREGHDVVVLEAGPRFDPAERPARMERALRPGHGRESVWAMGGERDAYASTGPQPYPLNRSRVKGVGGTSLHWEGIVMRLHEADFRRRTRDGVGVDWPIDYAELRPYYAAAESALGVAGASDNPFAPPREEPYPLPAFAPSASDAILADACESLGVATHSVPNARNSEPHAGAPACLGYGTCDPVCPSGAKYDATRHVAAAEAAGARVVDRAPVQRLEHDAAGERVTAAVYRTPDGTERRQPADRVVVACGGVETPRLLLCSATETYPDGLANTSGAVGRYFMDHCYAGTVARLDADTRQHQVGFMTSESHQFYDAPAAGTAGGIPAAPVTSPDGGDAGGESGSSPLGPIKLEFLNTAGPSPVAAAVTGDTWGDELRDRVAAEYGGYVEVGALVGQLPRADHRVALDPTTTDDHGRAVPAIHWGVDDRTRRTLERAADVQTAILEALGAEIQYRVGLDRPIPTFHHMGTTRMGTDPAASVVDARCRMHDLENCWLVGSSVFPTAGAMNPTLTVAALALRAAEDVDATL